MSLLIKALQKAEDEKISDGKTGASGGELSLEPRSSDALQGNPSANTRVEPALSLDTPSRPQQAAAGVFSAKRPLSTNSGSKKILLIAAASILLVLLIGMQVYSYFDALNQPVVLVPRPPVQPQPQAAPETQHQVVTEADGNTNLMAAPEANAAPDANIGASSADEMVQAEALTKEDQLRQSPAVAQNKPQQARSQELTMGEPIAAPREEAVKVTRNAVEIGVNPDLAIAYQAFNAGDEAKAQTYYRRALQSDVRNVDALLGMAAIASRQGRGQDAAGWYGKVLEVDPRNSIAQAALMSGYAQVDPVGAESRIKNMLALKPEAAHLHAALGNLYAEREEWAQAQQAYFQAHHFAPSNADYAFNLAVSLDHLGKAPLALQYYKQSLELLSTSGSGNIDRAQLESRILQLQ